MKSVGELSNVCSQIVLKYLYLARIGRPDILWSVNKLARSIIKWTKICDKRLNRLISYIHHTCEYKQYCHVGNTVKQWQTRTVSRLWLRRRSWRFEIHVWRNIVRLFGSHTCVPISWMCKKQTAVSHSSTESEIISLDTGLRLDDLSALELWDLIDAVLGNVSHVSDGSGQPDNEAPDHHYHDQFMESFSSVSYSKLDDDCAWSSHEWKTDTEMCERSARPDKIHWRMIRKVRLDFSHEEIRLDGTVQSVRNEETLRDTSGRLDIDSQAEARPQQFVIGNDEAELELSAESRSFVNRVNDQVRKRQKIISNCYRKWRRTIFDLVNIYVCNNGISGIHGKELPKQLSSYCEYDRSHT